MIVFDELGRVLEMKTWTGQELDDFCEQAIELLNKKKQLQLKLKNCWLFSNNSGSNLHIVYYSELIDADFYFRVNGIVLQEGIINVDKVAGLGKVNDIKLKIALRIAYSIYKNYQKAIKQDE